jgi:phytoene dehydrogenase-like protein
MDAIIIGSGPNGLTAAVALARAGVSVKVLEARETIGGGTRTEEVTLPGFHHDICSAVHPMGALSPYWRTLGLERFGLEWVEPELSFAHPFDGGRALALARSLDETTELFEAAGCAEDATAWRAMVGPYLAGNSDALIADILGPLGIPRRPFTMARFGMQGAIPAKLFAGMRFKSAEARGLFAGLAAHAVLPMSSLFTTAVGLMFAITAHRVSWPVAKGGSHAITGALAAYLRELGGTIETGRHVRSLSDLPESSVVLFDTSPAPMADICGDALPASYARRLRAVELGPATYKIDFALSEPIPWAADACRRTATVHLGGTLPEIAVSERLAWQGKAPRAPYVICCQQSLVDSGRAPEGKATGYAYCHVPHGFDGDASAAIEAQIERFAPGFADTVLARRIWAPADLEAHNENYTGGSITGGVSNWKQLVTRPVVRANPYTTPNPRLFICSASAPPGPGVHGMCGYYAARAALRQLGVRSNQKLLV